MVLCREFEVDGNFTLNSPHSTLFMPHRGRNIISVQYSVAFITTRTPHRGRNICFYGLIFIIHKSQLTRPIGDFSMCNVQLAMVLCRKFEKKSYDFISYVFLFLHKKKSRVYSALYYSLFTMFRCFFMQKAESGYITPLSTLHSHFMPSGFLVWKFHVSIHILSMSY